MAPILKDTIRLQAGTKRKRNEVDEASDAQSRILLLEDQILESQKSYNHIVTVLNYARNEDISSAPATRPLALVVLCRIFCKLILLGKLSRIAQASADQSTIVQWLNDRLSDFRDILLESFSKEDQGIQATNLTLLMKIFKVDAEHLQSSEESSWRRGWFTKILEALIGTKWSSAACSLFVETYANPFTDIRYHTFNFLGSVHTMANR